jgi:nanoRNase/pAp phosphatase (c-di-AMP/oligoRNAs hydrolase)
MDRLQYVLRAIQLGAMQDQVFSAFLGDAAREDFITYTADFFLQLEDVKWTIISGIVGDTLILSVRNLGYSRNAGEFVKKYFLELGSAGGHRAMAKAVVPMAKFRDKFGEGDAATISRTILDLAVQFLREHTPTDKKGRELQLKA